MKLITFYMIQISIYKRNIKSVQELIVLNTCVVVQESANENALKTGTKARTPVEDKEPEFISQYLKSNQIKQVYQL
ncbi:hypothetical protein BN7_1446 [Wickerhamomyces ciferrii]|uniref:Uncharacterized protein n=1 Tax=Wickerhamomyces ciferrii (strain ATCC 14091 / BCRC 22168 / CBS 111 / JCM 3599 / NBRC 0793 / NRRL Y-1031 F-60-10) TaxID=1206466 RepID=K0KIB2_WICCF|nr:uncharacterized protein BN7_1446 [Wickerhamomyces ciferrii]CCH41907.1 hypothetical protein BN7_1446 [Wickerhamomyces ciferrii]